MTSSDLWLAGVTSLLGLLGGWAISRFYFRKGSPRIKLNVGVVEQAHIVPETLGVRVQMKVGTKAVSNLYVYEISVTNRGPHDLEISDAEDETKHGLRARIEMPAGVRSLADPWNPTRATPRADVRVARQMRNGRQVFFIHLHRLAKDETVHAVVVCTHAGDLASQPLSPEQVGFFPGYLVDVDVEPSGLLRSYKGMLPS